MEQKQKEDMLRDWGNFHSMASWTAFMSKDQVSAMFQEHGDFLFCNGHGRKVVAEPLGADSYKVYTKPL